MKEIMEATIIVMIVLILNAIGIYIGYCYGRGVIVKVDDCIIYEDTLYCEPERTLTIDFGG